MSGDPSHHDEAGGVEDAEELSLLLVEDNDADARFIEELLADLTDPDREPAGPDDVRLTRRETLEAGVAALDGSDTDVVLLDLGLPGSRGLATLRTALEQIETVPVVVLTGSPERDLGIDAVSEGAQDYLVKDALSAATLVRTVRYAIERNRIERELQQRNEELTILARLLRHDIRNDASLVVGRGQELEAHVEPRGEALLEEMLAAANHIVELTRTAGDVTEAVTGREGMSVQPVDLADILQSEVAKARKLYGEDAVTVAGEIPPVEVRANELLGSVFANLIGNALVYSGTDTGEVMVDVELSADRAVVRVSDEGPGIPDEMKEHVFDQGVSTPESTGLGVGLYVVDRLVERYGGDIWVEDNEPTGAVFHVALDRGDDGATDRRR